VIVHSGLGESAYQQVLAEATSGKKRLVILVSPNGTVRDKRADYHLSSHDPKELLDLAIAKYPKAMIA